MFGMIRRWHLIDRILRPAQRIINELEQDVPSKEGPFFVSLSPVELYKWKADWFFNPKQKKQLKMHTKSWTFSLNIKNYQSDRIFFWRKKIVKSSDKY